MDWQPKPKPVVLLQSWHGVAPSMTVLDDERHELGEQLARIMLYRVPNVHMPNGADMTLEECIQWLEAEKAILGPCKLARLEAISPRGVPFQWERQVQETVYEPKGRRLIKSLQGDKRLRPRENVYLIFGVWRWAQDKAYTLAIRYVVMEAESSIKRGWRPCFLRTDVPLEELVRALSREGEQQCELYFGIRMDRKNGWVDDYYEKRIARGRARMEKK